MSIISVEKFKELAFQTIKLTPFPGSDEPIEVRVKATGIMNLLSNGKLPNTLMSTVNEVFNGSKDIGLDKSKGISDAQKQELTDKLTGGGSNMADMAEMLRVFAAETLVEPTFDEIGDLLTDQQLNDLFDYSMGGLDKIDNFRTEQSDANGASDSNDVPPIA